MKTFIAACILLLVLGGGVCANALILLDRTHTLQAQAASLEEGAPAGREAAVMAFRKQWEKEKILFILSVNQNDLEKVEDALARLEACAKIESDSNFAITVAELKEALERVRVLVGFSAEGLL